MKYQIKNWDKFQQYKDDRPVHWIKLHVELLDDYHFEELPELEQLYILKLWLFAAKNKGCFEGSDKFIARKIGASKLSMDNLVRTGFIVRTEEYESVPREEESREEESREKKVCHADSVINYLNGKRKSKYRAIGSNADVINARIKEGYTVDDLISVIDSKIVDWGGDHKMSQYLRPATLFGKEKFSQYIGEVGVQRPKAINSYGFNNDTRTPQEITDSQRAFGADR